MPGINYSAHQYNPIAQGSGAAYASAKAASDAASAGLAASGEKKDDGFSFGDLLDIVNPLQHIPVVSTLYRHLTGDKIGTFAKLAGDTLYGGWTGLAFSAADSAYKEISGKTVGDTVYAMVIGDDTPKTAIADANTPVAVKPARSEPSLEGLADTVSETVGDIARQTGEGAARAYRAAGHLLAAY
ncbi:hypothetical protein FHS83_001418 [Rhizomicrobium palustre]|uniref:Uncharacterized protein n=1 Tax=Rhizomicrobium palustre TaxID=189966 RepID=A0A846MYP4_9PROT|nr:hypothetical protein [Rhizomicrobium palustre]NIK88100.1 hypothetical protein [Rhizomicrobium palustre]